MTRRLYTVMDNAQKAMVGWLAALLFFSLFECCSVYHDFFSTYFFVVLQMPLYALVMFGSYALMTIGYHLYVLVDCNDAHAEIRREIDEAKAFLTQKGMKFD
jgi:hypothetical protein